MKKQGFSQPQRAVSFHGNHPGAWFEWHAGPVAAGCVLHIKREKTVIGQRESLPWLWTFITVNNFTNTRVCYSIDRLGHRLVKCPGHRRQSHPRVRASTFLCAEPKPEQAERCSGSEEHMRNNGWIHYGWSYRLSWMTVVGISPHPHLFVFLRHCLKAPGKTGCFPWDRSDSVEPAAVGQRRLPKREFQSVLKLSHIIRNNNIYKRRKLRWTFMGVLCISSLHKTWKLNDFRLFVTKKYLLTVWVQANTELFNKL